MSTPNTDPPQDPQDPQNGPENAPEPTPEPEGGANREAAMRRRQLREVEAERDTLRERLDDHDKREVERVAAESLADPGDVWLATSLDAMRDEDGALDAEKVGAELARITQEKPHWMKPYPNVHPGPRASAERDGPSFGQTVKRALGG